MSSLIVEVCKIKDIQPHTNADRLEIATVKGWNVIIQKGQYKIGDLVIFIPPDSILPQNLIEKYELDYLKKDGRVGTVKLRGFISQGLVLPANELTSFHSYEGENVAGLLGITKWAPPEPKENQNVKGRVISKKKLNPLFDKYTDIENIKNFPDVFEIGENVVITEKLHGTNFRAGWLPIERYDESSIWVKFISWYKKNILGQKYEFVWGSHNVQKGVSINQKDFYGEDVWSQIVNSYYLKSKLPLGYIFYGEVVGKNIQDLNYGFTKELHLYIFDVKNVKTNQYLDYAEMFRLCLSLDLPTVPEDYWGEYNQEIVNELTSGFSELAPNQIREGIVIRPYKESHHNKLGRKILKSINPDYLLRKNGTEFK